MVRQHAPILRTVGAALFSFVAVVALGYDGLRPSAGPALALWFVAGALYTNLFEYWVHRFPMHQGLPLMRHVRHHHVKHHRTFHGSNFRTQNPRDFAHISGRSWIFPILLAAHYILLTAFLPTDATLVFLAACLLHYLGFEVSHWLTHVDGNAVDRALARVPLLGALRFHQIEHHRRHHQTPVRSFNFSPPYLGDALMARQSKARPTSSPAPAPVAARRAVARPAVLFGTALVLGVIALGIAAVREMRLTAATPSPRAKP